MTTGRLEAFTDAVIAIVITILVLELRAPHKPDLEALRGVVPVFLTYVLSFVMLGIYWNNHHHMFQIADHVDGSILWANLHLLFWLSLFPFATAWMGENDFAPVPVAIYGVVAVMAAVAYFLLVRALVRCQPADTRLAEAIGSDTKGKISPLIYAFAVPIALLPVPFAPFVAFALYVVVALIWVVPDVRIERTIAR